MRQLHMKIRLLFLTILLFSNLLFAEKIELYINGNNEKRENKIKYYCIELDNDGIISNVKLNNEEVFNYEKMLNDYYDIKIERTDKKVLVEKTDSIEEYFPGDAYFIEKNVFHKKLVNGFEEKQITDKLLFCYSLYDNYIYQNNTNKFSEFCKYFYRINNSYYVYDYVFEYGEGFVFTSFDAKLVNPTLIYNNNELINCVNYKIMNYILGRNIIFIAPFIFSDNPIKNIKSDWIYSASSELMENNYLYAASNLCSYDGKPWVSSNGYGIGDVITISFKNEIPNSLLLLNGYVNPEKEYLYLENSRVKKIEIKNVKTKQKYIYEIKDIDVLQNIPIKNLFNNEKSGNEIEIKILEVYAGSKYKDVCIQAIIPNNTNIIYNKNTE